MSLSRSAAATEARPSSAAPSGAKGRRPGSVRTQEFVGCCHWPECACDGVCFIRRKPRHFPLLRVTLGGLAFAALAVAARIGWEAWL